MTQPNKPAALDAVAWMYEREANEVERAATVINLTRWSREQALGWTETPLTDLNKAQERIDRLEETLEWYADQMCEGWCDKNPVACNAIGSENCAGCPARAALTTAIPLIQAQERARIAKWLRDVSVSPLGHGPVQKEVALLADAIEQGKHNG